MYAHAHTHTHTHAHAFQPPEWQVLGCKSLMEYACVSVLSLTHTHARTHAQTHTHTNILTDRQTHTHTHAHTPAPKVASAKVQGAAEIHLRM